MASKLAVCSAVAGAGILAFASGWLRGYVEGAQGAAQQIMVLRRVAQGVGEDGCEWVLTQPDSRGQRSVSSIPALRYHTPYVNTPILERLTTVEVAGPFRS
jgi:hypothetical protein